MAAAPPHISLGRAVGAWQSDKGSFEGLGEYKDLPPRSHDHEDQSVLAADCRQRATPKWRTLRKLNIPGGVAAENVSLDFVFENPSFE